MDLMGKLIDLNTRYGDPPIEIADDFDVEAKRCESCNKKIRRGQRVMHYMDGVVTCAQCDD